VLDKEQIDRTCKTLHLTFKQATTEEIYDTLVFCLIKAARKYDPFYTDKVEEVCGIINVLPKQFTEQHLLDRVGYDCLGILRSLVRKHYLRSVTGRRRSWDTGWKSLAKVLGGYWWRLLKFTRLPTMPLDQITKEVVECTRFTRPMVNRRTGEQTSEVVPCSPTYINQAIRTLKTMLGRAEEWRIIDRVPKITALSKSMGHAGIKSMAPYQHPKHSKDAGFGGTEHSTLNRQVEGSIPSAFHHHFNRLLVTNHHGFRKPHFGVSMMKDCNS
jgi:hypothetical protein